MKHVDYLNALQEHKENLDRWTKPATGLFTAIIGDITITVERINDTRTVWQVEHTAHGRIASGVSGSPAEARAHACGTAKEWVREQSAAEVSI